MTRNKTLRQRHPSLTGGYDMGTLTRVRQQRGVVALEYILVCALLMLGVAFVTPMAMELFQYAYQAIVAVVCSPFPAGF